jgi:CMP-N,N'-diacetyllegionaminic acid synthase
MINGKKILAIIPARGGSKGLPGKNIRPMCGKPLIAWTVEAAAKSRYLDCAVVSTDSAEIAEAARAAGGYVPFLRPDEFATDKASSYDVIRHALAYLSEHTQRQFDYVVLLEPTSPLREDDDIDKMLEQLLARSDEFDSIISIGEVGEHPSIMKKCVGETLVPYSAELVQTTRRQDNDAAYFPYGVAYIAKTEVLLAENTFYTRRCMAYRIQRYQNFEIDDIYNFLCVESVMKHEWRIA